MLAGPGRRIARALLPALIAAGALAAVLQPAHAEGGDEATVPPGWRPFDGGALLTPADYQGNSMPVELALDLFASGTPAVKWVTSTSPTVLFCTHHANRPSWVSAERFRQSVARAADVWNTSGAKVGIRYEGDCANGFTWGADNRVNEVGWDDSRNFVRSPAAAVTQGSWRVGASRRDFVETDVVLDNALRAPEACLDSTVTHELGHALGLGHSDTLGDLMFPSFDSDDARTCPAGPSAAEVAMLRSLYGVNQQPRVSTGPAQTVGAGKRATLSAQASDADGDALTFTWTQTAGPLVALTPDGESVSFTAPDKPSTLTFTVAAYDRYLNRGSATLTVSVTAGSAAPQPDSTDAPSEAPSLETLRASHDRANMALGWTTVDGATAYRVCSTPTGSSVQTCAVQTSSVVNVTWDTVLGPAVANETVRVLTSGTRETTLQACNTRGCSTPGAGPHAGGLVWKAHQVNYDYFAMAFDVPGTRIKFTIAGVVNVSGPARRFTLFSGEDGDFAAKRFKSCGNVGAGNTCIGLLGPMHGGHTSHVTIRSERATTPAVEHRVRVR